jgi:hypothetical protein
MILAKNDFFSLHELEPDTYSHETYVLVERFGSTQEQDYRVTLFSAPKKEQKEQLEQLEKLIRSIKNGANGSNIKLYPLHFICRFLDLGKCPANERASALKELRLAKEQNAFVEETQN